VWEISEICCNVFVCVDMCCREDITVSRMGMYDDTYTKVPTMGWMFVPIVDYHGGGVCICVYVCVC